MTLIWMFLYALWECPVYIFTVMQVQQVMIDLAATIVNGIWSDTDNLKQFGENSILVIYYGINWQNLLIVYRQL